MRWPWQRRTERRASLAYTDAITAAFEAAALGQSAIGETAAVEAAASCYARGFAAATVENASDAISRAISPTVLASIGRDLVRRGESVWLIETGAFGLRLRRVGAWDVRGGSLESSWTVRVTTYGPSGSETRIVPYAAVVHCRYATDPSRPWHGIGPVAWAGSSARLHAGAVGALAADMSALPASVVPMPPGENTDDEDEDPLAPLKARLVGAKGRSLLVESTRGAFGGDHRDAPRDDWTQKRLGPNPPETLADVHDRSAHAILAACGVDPVLVGWTRGDGTLAREAYRRFDRLGLQPVARTVADELRAKLDAPALSLSFDSLRASDFAGVARAFKAMVEAGVSVDAAAAILDIEV